MSVISASSFVAESVESLTITQMADDAPPNLPDIDYLGELRFTRTGTVERMKAIIRILEAPMDILKAQQIDDPYIGDLLDELEDLVSAVDRLSSVDRLSAFHSAGGLVPILNILKHIESGLRARAANVVAALVWCNPDSQRLVMQANGFETLFEVFTSDRNVVTRLCALGAIFSLIRNNKRAVTLFRCANGYEALIQPLTSQDVFYQRQALDLIYLILEEEPGESVIMHELGYPHMMIALGNSGDAEVREAALWALITLAGILKEKITRNKVADNINDTFAVDTIKPFLEERIGYIISLNEEDYRDARIERLLVETLWMACFDESSCLVEKGLVFLPGESTAPPVRQFTIQHFTINY